MSQGQVAVRREDLSPDCLLSITATTTEDWPTIEEGAEGESLELALLLSAVAGEPPGGTRILGVVEARQRITARVLGDILALAEESAVSCVRPFVACPPGTCSETRETDAASLKLTLICRGAMQGGTGRSLDEILGRDAGRSLGRNLNDILGKGPRRAPVKKPEKKPRKKKPDAKGQPKILPVPEAVKRITAGLLRDILLLAECQPLRYPTATPRAVSEGPFWKATRGGEDSFPPHLPLGVEEVPVTMVHPEHEA